MKYKQEEKAETIAMEWRGTRDTEMKHKTETKMKMKPRDVKAIFVHSHNNHTLST